MTLASPFGAQLRHWRKIRGISQLDLAVKACTTPRHVSFLETGRSRPRSPMIHRLAEAMDLPLRGRNDLLLAAGLTAEIPERDLAAPQMQPIQRVVSQMLRTHAPYPAIAHDHLWRVVDANAPARALFGMTPGTNMLDVMLTAGPLRDSIVDWPGWAWAYVDRIRRESALGAGVPEFQAVLDRAMRLLDGVPRPTDGPDGNDPVWTPTVRQGGQEARLLTTVARFTSPRDVTVEDLRVELVYPYDEASDVVLRGWIAAAQA